MPRRANGALMTLKWSCSGCLRPLLFPMKDNLPRSGRSIASNNVVSPEPVSLQTRASPAAISSSACSMHRRPVTASSLRTMGPHPADPDLRSPRPRRPAGPLERRPGSVRKSLGPRTQRPRAERPLADARGSIRPICSTWNPSSDLPKQPGRAPRPLAAHGALERILRLRTPWPAQSAQGLPPRPMPMRHLRKHPVWRPQVRRRPARGLWQLTAPVRAPKATRPARRQMTPARTLRAGRR